MYEPLAAYIQDYFFPSLSQDFSKTYIESNTHLQRVAQGLTLQEFKNEDLQHRNLEFEYHVVL